MRKRQPTVVQSVMPTRCSKRAKTIISQSTTNFKRQRSRSVTDASDETQKRRRSDIVCSKCKKKDTEHLVNCKGNCLNKIHSACIPIQLDENGAHLWECDECQLCSTCNKGSMEGTTFLKCYECLTSFHKECYVKTSEDNIRMVKERRFLCATCDKKRKAKQRTPTTSNRTVIKNTKEKRSVSIDCLGLNDASESEVFLGFHQSELGPSIPNPTEPSLVHQIDRNLANNDRSKSVQRSPTQQSLANNDRSESGQRQPPAKQNFANNDRSKSVQRSSERKNLANNDRNEIADNPIIPDASQWSSNQVFEYFKVKFPRHAHVFEDEEIDGESLSYLKREDIVRGFKIKIGPSVKIFNHVEKMQQQMKLNKST